MDRAMQLAHLAQAEQHIASGLRHIENQEQIIAGLGQRFHDLNHIRLPRQACMTKCG
jgi:hypothetical protein